MEKPAKPRPEGHPENRPAPVAAERVGILTADPLRLAGLQAICAETLGTEVVPIAPGAGQSDFGLVLIDAETTPHLFEVIAALRRTHPSARLLVLGNAVSAETIERIIDAGARGYLTLGAPEAEVRMAVSIVRDGSVWAPRKVLAHLLDRHQSEHAGPSARPAFTARERDVLQLLHAGRSNREIARALEIDESTVKAHIGRLMRKVGVNNRTALTVHPLTRLV
jgi:DNA-binding NarL/FixJ family response regulator